MKVVPTATSPSVADREAPLSLAYTLLILVLCLAVPPLLIEFWLPYWEYTDQDLVLAYNALLMNQGLPQEYFDHPGYAYFLLLSGWYRLLHGLGLISLSAFGDLPPLSDPVAYDAAWTELIRAGRVFSMTLGTAGVALFTTTIRRVSGHGWIALIIGLGLVFSMGFNQQIRQMRTDFLSGSCAMAVLCFGLLAARLQGGAGEPRRPWAVLGLLFLTGLAAALSVVTKVQGLFVCVAIAPLLVVYGQPWPEDARTPGRAGLALLALAVAAVGVPAAALIIESVGASGGAFGYKQIGFSLSGIYQSAIVAGIIGCMAAYARVWGVPRRMALAAGLAVAAGMAVGIHSLHLVWDARNAIAVANPLEHMFVFSVFKHGDQLAASGAVLNPTLATLVGEGFLRTLAIRTIVLFPDRIPQTVIFEWAIIAGVVIAWRRGWRPVALRAGLLLFVAWALESLFILRGFQRAYAIYTEPFVLLAAAYLLSAFAADVARLPVRRTLGAALAAYLLAAQAWPVTYLLRYRPDINLPCELTRTIYLPRLEGFPICSGHAAGAKPPAMP